MEFEVYEDAVRNYKKYDVYSNWKLEGSSMKGRPFAPSMKGYYLKSDNFPTCVIVGDILTSNKIWGKPERRKNKKIDDELKKFEKLYHIDGNYIPIPEIKDMPSANLRGKNCDTYTHHLNICKQAIERSTERYGAWNVWASKIWIPYCKKMGFDNYWEKFVQDFYLIDFVDNEMNPKSFVKGRPSSNQVGIRDEDDDDEIMLDTIKNCIDLIIKRDYRINNKIFTKFDCAQNESYCKYKYELLCKIDKDNI